MASVTFPTLPSFPGLDFSKLDLSKLPSFDMPKLPTIDMPQLDTEALANAAKDAAYVTIGLGVMAFQKAQVRRREIAKSVTDQFGSGKAQVDEVVDAIEARLATLDSKLDVLEGKLDSAVGDLEKRLPERAGAMLSTAHDAAKTARKQVRGLIVTAA